MTVTFRGGGDVVTLRILGYMRHSIRIIILSSTDTLPTSTLRTGAGMMGTLAVLQKDRLTRIRKTGGQEDNLGGL
jgi:hypothetical protein